MPDRAIYLEDVTQLAGDGATDDTAAFYAAIMGATPGDWIVGKKGAEYRIVGLGGVSTKGIPLNGVHFDPNNSTVSFEFSTPHTFGFRMQNRGSVWGEGLVHTPVSNNGSSQRIDHAPIAVGCAYGDDGPFNVTNPFLDQRTWRVGGGVRLNTAKPDGSIIGCHGSFEDYLIEDVFFEDSATAGLCIGMDWLPRGLDMSVDTWEVMRTKWSNGQGYTMHPGAGIINRIYAGAMSYSGAAAEDGGPTIIRLSAAHDVSIQHVHAKQASALFRTVGGDFGREYAQNGAAARISRGHRVEHMRLDTQVGSNAVVHLDSLGDNVYGAAGYVPTYDPLMSSDIVVSDVISYSGSPTQHAFVARMIRGAKFINCSSSGHLRSVSIEEGSDDVHVIGGRHENTQLHGIMIDGTLAPQDALVQSCKLSMNGMASPGTYASIIAQKAARPGILGNVIGKKIGDVETQGVGIRISPNATGYAQSNNQILALSNGGTPISIG
jgi:hypothetical protein